MQNITTLITETMTTVIQSLMHNWIPLGLAILSAAIMRVYINQEKLKAFLLKKTHVSIVSSVMVGAFTPLCACGTMAVIIGMLTTTLPWGPIMAFLTSSPLMSPDGFFLTAGILGVRFAVALTLSSIVMGFGSGYATHFIQKNTGFLNNQTRFRDKKPEPACGCTGTPKPGVSLCCAAADFARPVVDNISIPAAQVVCGCGSAPPVPAGAGHNVHPSGKQSKGFRRNPLQRIKWRETARAIVNVGLKQILLYYSIFVAVGFLINRFVPTSFIMALFSGKNIFAVPLAAVIGLPIYVSGEASIPLVKALLAGGAGGGAMLAFLITGPGTSAWVIAGIATFLKKRIIGLYVFFLLVGGILLGYVYDLLIASGILG